MTAQSNYLAGKRTEIHPYKTREGGATVTVFVPYNCLNNCPFCINKAEYENPEGFSADKICESIRRMDAITPYCDFVFTGGEPFADLNVLQQMLDEIPKTHKVFRERLYSFASTIRKRLRKTYMRLNMTRFWAI